MKNVILSVAMVTLLLGCSGTKGFETDELAKICAEGNGKLVSSTLVKAEDGSITGEIKVDNEGTILNYKCTGDTVGGWGVEIINDEPTPDAASEGSDAGEPAAAEANTPKEISDQLLEAYPGYKMISYEALESEVMDGTRFNAKITVRNPNGKDESYVCDGAVTDGVINNYTCEQP